MVLRQFKQSPCRDGVSQTLFFRYSGPLRDRSHIQWFRTLPKQYFLQYLDRHNAEVFESRYIFPRQTFFFFSGRAPLCARLWTGACRLNLSFPKQVPNFFSLYIIVFQNRVVFSYNAPGDRKALLSKAFLASSTIDRRENGFFSHPYEPFTIKIALPSLVTIFSTPRSKYAVSRKNEPNSHKHTRFSLL